MQLRSHLQELLLGLQGQLCCRLVLHPCLLMSCMHASALLSSHPNPYPSMQVAHSWRTTFDIHASWESVMQNLDESIGLARYAGPGAWNDLVSRAEGGAGGRQLLSGGRAQAAWSAGQRGLSRIVGQTADLRCAQPACNWVHHLSA